MENIENISGEEEAKKSRGRPRFALWRYNEDGTYNNKPISESYFHDYHKAHLAIVECEFCHRHLTIQKLKRHKLSNKNCLIIQNLLT